MGLYGGPAWRREKSPRRLADEVIAFREQFGLDFIYFVDEIFLTKSERIREFSEIFKTEIRTPFSFMERPELINEDKMALMSEAGAYVACIGIESGDEDFRRKELDRRHSNEAIIKAFGITRKYGVKTHAFNMVGFPNETKDTIKASFDLLSNTKPDTFQVSIFYPLRGTVLHDLSLEEGWLEDETMPDNYYQDSVLELPNRSKKEIVDSKYLLTMFAGRGDMKSRFLFHFFINFPLGLGIYRRVKYAMDIYGVKRSVVRAGGRLFANVLGLGRRQAPRAAPVQAEQIEVVNRGTDPIYEKPVEL